MAMDKQQSVEKVREFYNHSPETEWNRLEEHPVEFAITCSYLDRYIKPGDRVLDLGGGPGRYSLFLAERGCTVTLCDLSEGNVAFALAKAREQGLSLHTMCGDAREIGSLAEGEFDHILLMGPLYHLLEEADRVRAVEGCLSHLKAGGCLFASFITTYAGMIYELRECPEQFPTEDPSLERCLVEDIPFTGQAFTQAYFARIGDVLPFFAPFPLKKLHLLGSESVLAPFEHQFLEQPPEIRQWLIGFAEKLCEREELLSYTEHLLYVGQRQASILCERRNGSA